MENNGVHELWEMDVKAKIAEAKKHLNEIILAHKYCGKVGGPEGSEIFAEGLMDSIVRAAQEMAGINIDELESPLAFPVDFRGVKPRLDNATDRFLFQATHFMGEYKKHGLDDDLYTAKKYLQLAKGTDVSDLPRYGRMIIALEKEFNAL